MAPPINVDVVVLGAGVAGLASARYAAGHGRSVLVLDRASQVGGLAASIDVGGQRVDLGSHRLHGSIRPDLLADLRARLGAGLQLRARNGRIRLDGRWVGFPLRPFDVVRNSRLRFAARVIVDIASAPVRRRRAAGDDFGSLVRAGMGPAIASTFYEPYARKLWGVDAGDLSGELFRRRVGARTAATVLRRSIRRGRDRDFWYPVGGFGRIAEALAADVIALGGEIALGAEVRNLISGPGHVMVERGGAPPLRAGTVVSTIPARDLARIAGAPDVVTGAAERLEHRGVVLVYLSVPQPRYTPFDAHYFPGAPATIARLSEPKGYRLDPADPPDRSVVCAELPATVGDCTWTLGDDDLTRLVREELVSVGLPDPAPIDAHVERRSHVYPVYRLGFEQHQRIVDVWVDGLDGVVALGRQALFAHDNTHHALAMGHTVAQCIDSSGRVDRAVWRAARAAFADHVVED